MSAPSPRWWVLPRAALRAHRWPASIVLLASCSVGNAVVGRKLVSVPFVDLPLPSWSLLSAIAVVIAVVPLASSFPELETSLAREPILRIVRCAAALGLIVLAMTPAYLRSPDVESRHVMLEFTAILFAIGLASVAVIGDWAWAPPLTAGMAILMLDSGISEPVSTVLYRIPVAPTLALCLIAVVVYGRVGPRRFG